MERIPEEGDKRRRVLHKVMEHLKLNQTELCSKAGLRNANVLYNVLNGRSDSLNITTYRRLGRVVGLNVSQLIGELPLPWEVTDASSTIDVVTADSKEPQAHGTDYRAGRDDIEITYAGGDFLFTRIVQVSRTERMCLLESLARYKEATLKSRLLYTGPRTSAANAQGRGEDADMTLSTAPNGESTEYPVVERPRKRTINKSANQILVEGPGYRFTLLPPGLGPVKSSWYLRGTLDGKQIRSSTGTIHLALSKRIAHLVGNGLTLDEAKLRAGNAVVVERARDPTEERMIQNWLRRRHDV